MQDPWRAREAQRGLLPENDLACVIPAVVDSQLRAGLEMPPQPRRRVRALVHHCGEARLFERFRAEDWVMGGGSQSQEKSESTKIRPESLSTRREVGQVGGGGEAI